MLFCYVQLLQLMIQIMIQIKFFISFMSNRQIVFFVFLSQDVTSVISSIEEKVITARASGFASRREQRF
jgi:hypothetical protein